eukprot:scaffold75366_cov15-Tisochrysis_lutea.AAC.1
MQMLQFFEERGIGREVLEACGVYSALVKPPVLLESEQEDAEMGKGIPQGSTAASSVSLGLLFGAASGSVVAAHSRATWLEYPPNRLNDTEKRRWATRAQFKWTALRRCRAPAQTLMPGLPEHTECTEGGSEGQEALVHCAVMPYRDSNGKEVSRTYMYLDAVALEEEVHGRTPIQLRSPPGYEGPRL